LGGEFGSDMGYSIGAMERQGGDRERGVSGTLREGKVIGTRVKNRRDVWTRYYIY